jgi:hypothetical protein
MLCSVRVRAPARYPLSRTRHHCHFLAVSETSTLSFQLTSWPLLLDRLLSRLCSRFYIHAHPASVSAPGGSRTRPRFAHIRRHVLPRVSRSHTPPWTVRPAVEAINRSWSRQSHTESSRRSRVCSPLSATRRLLAPRPSHVPPQNASSTTSRPRSPSRCSSTFRPQCHQFRLHRLSCRHRRRVMPGRPCSGPCLHSLSVPH